ncbi:MAG: nitroreductase family protein [Oscillospiraceae bacterium]|nr:nitroreductase family protein [Oscillospiraceae bacterium]
MNYFVAVIERYSHKERFLPNVVPQRILDKIADAGLRAPTGNNTQCVKLVILRNRDEVQRLGDIVGTNALLTAPAAIAVLTDSKGHRAPYNFEIEDYSAAATQMLLAAVAMGYASLWLDSPFFDEAKQAAALEALGASNRYHLRVVLPIGLPDGEGSRRDKLSFGERVSYGKLKD